MHGLNGQHDTICVANKIFYYIHYDFQSLIPAQM